MKLKIHNITKFYSKCNKRFKNSVLNNPGKLVRCQAAFNSKSHSVNRTQRMINHFRDARRHIAPEAYNTTANEHIQARIAAGRNKPEEFNWLMNCKNCGKSFHTYAGKHASCYRKAATEWHQKQLGKKLIYRLNRKERNQRTSIKVLKI